MSRTQFDRRWWIGATVGALVVPLVLLALWKHRPTFYELALAEDRQSQTAASNRFQERCGALTGNLQRDGAWQALLTDEEINAWLAVDCERQLPNWLPPGLSEPRVRIGRQHVDVACRWGEGVLATVLRLEFDAYLTEPDELVLRFRRARAGRVPMPLKAVLEQLTRVAEHNHWQLRWLQAAGDPVAVLRLPWPSDEARRRTLQRLELSAGQLYLAGATLDRGAVASREAEDAQRRAAHQSATSENVQR